MAVAVIQEFPATLEQYEAVGEKLVAQGDPPEGLIIHTGGQVEGGMRIFDVWESEQAYQAFVEQRLGPAVAETVGEAAGPPETTIYELHDVLQP